MKENNSKNELLISVVVPVYNVEKYLGRCVDSIINQTYANLEIILVDDGSTDNSGKICDDYLNKDNRIHVIHKVNGGLSDARNTGIDESKGEYILFVDSDDYISNRMVEALCKSMLENESDLALCNFTYVDERGNALQDKNKYSPIKNEVLTSYDALRRISGFPGSWYYVVAWNKLYKKELFNNIKFPYGKCHEDEFIVHKIFDKCNTISCVEERLYFYVQRTDSIMNQKYSIKRLDGAEACAERTKYFLEKKEYRFASKALSAGMSVLAGAYDRLDFNIAENNTRYCQLKDRLTEIFRSNTIWLLKNSTARDWVKIISFMFGMKFYKKVQRTLGGR